MRRQSTLGSLIHLAALQAQQVLNGFTAQRAYIQLAAACKKPSSPASYETIIKPTQQALMAVIDYKEKNRASKESNQLTVVAEGIPALGWVMAVSADLALRWESRANRHLRML